MTLCQPCADRFHDAKASGARTFVCCAACLNMMHQERSGVFWDGVSRFARGTGHNGQPIIDARFEVKPKAPKSEPLNAGSAAATREYHDIMKDRIGAFRSAYEYGTRRPHWPLNIKLGDDE